MTEARVQRRLAAILAADVVGFSRMMQENEAGTLAALKARRSDILAPTVARHKGRVVKLMGDGVLVEFASAVDAVQCGLALQRGFAAANDGPPSRHITLRIGINLGDVIVEGSDLYGDGVNLAARLEGIADPGGLCVSAKVMAEVAGKIDAAFEDMGERSLKNIALPQRVYRVSGTAAPRAEPLALPSKPSVAVLPFANLSGDPEQEYLTDGLTEDLITGLSRVRDIFVIARNSAFAYKGRTVPVKDVARDLGVRYVLEGSIRKSGPRVRISAQLVDATTGHPIWADKYDRDLIEIFDLQDEITRNVVATTQTQIRLAEGTLYQATNRPEIGTWGLVTRAMFCIYALTPDSLAEAKRIAEQAIALDETYGPAWRCKAIAVYHFAHMRIAPDYDATLDEALALAERAVRLDPGDEYAHWALGLSLAARHQHERAIAELERVTEIAPNYSTGRGSLGTVLCYVGRAAEGIACNEDAIRSDPLNPSIFFRYSGLALGLYLTGDYTGAAATAMKSIRLNRNWYLGHLYRIAALGQLDRSDDTRAALQDYRAVFPAASVQDADRLPFRGTADLDHLRDGLRKAGLPDAPPA